MSEHDRDTKKTKMLTSREIYNRIIWDARLDRDVFIIGYADRLEATGIREKLLVEWQPDGDIPWHRIRYFRCHKIVVWDRDQHLDLFNTNQLPNSAWLTPLEHNIPIKDQPADFKFHKVYQFIDHHWKTINDIDNIKTNHLKVATYNILCDIYEADLIYTDQRIEAIINYLKEIDAEIITLQEVTSKFYKELLKADWLQNYFISESPDTTKLNPYGMVLISKYPFTLVDHWYTEQKRALIASWQLNSSFLHVGVIHLSSNHTENAIYVRSKQLQKVLQHIDNLKGDAIIMGDFNCTSAENGLELINYGFQDLWEMFRSDEDGYTYDATQNNLAMLMSRSGRRARLDRITHRSMQSTTQNGWHPDKISLFADQPIAETPEKLFASDHYGLLANFEYINLASEKLTTNNIIKLNELISRLMPPLTELDEQSRNEAIKFIKEKCFELLNFDIEIVPVGSSMLGVASKDSDLDLLVLIPTKISQIEFFTVLKDLLAPHCAQIRIVQDAQVPILRLKLNGVDIDLIYANLFYKPASDNANDLNQVNQLNRVDETNKSHQLDQVVKLDRSILINLDDISRRNISSYLESTEILKVATFYISLEKFIELTRAVRAWVLVRRLSGKGFGFPGSFSWTLLITWSLIDLDESVDKNDLTKLLINFFQRVVTHNWIDAIALNNEARNYQPHIPPDWLPIINSVPPYKNTARNMVNSTFYLIRSEFARAIKIIDQIKAGLDQWHALYEPVDLLKIAKLYLVIKISTKHQQDFDQASGWLSGHIIGLILKIEQQTKTNIRSNIRPWPNILRDDQYGYFIVGLEIDSSLKDKIIQIAKDFMAQIDTKIDFAISILNAHEMSLIVSSIEIE